MIEGKTPPQAIDMEEAVIGTILLEGRSLERVIDYLPVEAFYKASHTIIYQAILDLHQKMEPIDLLTVTERLRETKDIDTVGGAYALTKLMDRVGSSAHIETHASIILSRYMQRELIRAGHEMIRDAYDNDPHEVGETIQDQITMITNVRGSTLEHIGKVAERVFKVIDQNLKDKKEINGIPTGLKVYDEHSGGLQKGDLMVLGAETSQGKTSLGLTIAGNAAALGHKVGIWSYEMTNVQLTARMMAAVTGVGAKRILMKPLSPAELENVNTKVQRLIEKMIYMDDCSSSKFDSLIASLRTAVRKYGIELAIIDYLQLITNDMKHKSTEEQVADIANRLKALAKMLGISIILISQLARDRDKPIPSRSRLKRSGDIENAADVIMLTWFPEQYGYDTIRINDEELPTEGLSHVIIAKGRNIGMIEFPLRFHKEITYFEDYTPNINPF